MDAESVVPRTVVSLKEILLLLLSLVPLFDIILEHRIKKSTMTKPGILIVFFNDMVLNFETWPEYKSNSYNHLVAEKG